jgi:hypothetical protein
MRKQWHYTYIHFYAVEAFSLSLDQYKNER